MERVVHISHSFKAADEWDRTQQRSMSAAQRIHAARVLQRKAYGDLKEIRSCRKTN
jgi:hypothetical protein